MVALVALVGLVTAALGGLFWAEYHLRAARHALEHGRNAEAIAHLRTCRLVLADHPEVALLSARAARRAGSWAEAEMILDQYSQQRGDDDRLALERLLLRAAQGDLETTHALLQARIAQDDPAAPLAREALAAGLLSRFHLDEAGRQIDRWLAHEPDSTLALLAQARLHDLRERPADALESYRRVVEIDPEHDGARLRLAGYLLQENKSEEALPHLQQLHRREPGNAEVQVQLARALNLQGRPDEARTVLDECLRGQPDYPPALAESGKLALEGGDAERAEELLARAVRLDPGELPARFQYFLALTQNGKKEEAEKQRTRINEMEADSRRIHDLVQGRLRQTPDDPDVHHEVAIIALRAGQPRQALRWLQSALRVDPEHLPTHRVLAGYYQQIGSPILAARHRAIAQRLGGAQP